MNRRTGLLLLWGSVGLAASCDVMSKLRAMFHGEDDTARTAGLRVEVVPATGISILLDGARVATRSPYVGTALKGGPHRLEVRGMGYYPVVLPIALTADKTVTIPVSLRPRPEGDPQPDEAPPVEPPPPAPPSPPAPALPAGVDAIELQVIAEPEVPLLLDGVAVSGKVVKLARVQGDIVVGVLTVHYRFGGSGLLELSVPDDGARWYRDGGPFKGGAGFKLNHGATRLRRVADDGTDQSAVLRR